MKIHDIEITGYSVFKAHFDLSELDDCIDNGTLFAFERDCQNKGDSIFLCQSIMDALRARRTSGTPDFYEDGRLVREKLKNKLDGIPGFNDYTAHSNDKDKNFWNDGRWDIVRKTAAPFENSCTLEQVWHFYVYILLCVQAFPKEAFPGTAIDALRRLVELKTDSGLFYPQARQLYPGPPALSVVGKRVLLSDGEGILSLECGRWKKICGQPVRSFAYTKELGLIAITADGMLLERTNKEVCGLADGQRLAMVSACGRRFALLTENGRLLTNLKLKDPGSWKVLVSVQMGLNSLTGITKPICGMLQAGSDPSLINFTGVKTAHTRTVGGRNIYAVLRRNGELFLDCRRDPVRSVSAVGLGSGGYFYTIQTANGGASLMQRSFDGDERRLAVYKPGFYPLEVCVSEERVACLGSSKKMPEVKLMDL